MNPHAYLTDPEQIRTVESIKRVDKDGYLYHMDCTFDYYDIPEQFKAVIDAGCSVFLSKDSGGNLMYVRNYDYSHYLNNEKKNPRTGINVIVECKNPKAKYRSIGVADAYWLDFQHGSLANGCADDGVTDISSFVLLPYICMDGMNEKGLAVSILALSVESEWHEIPFDEYQDKLNENKFNFFYDEPGKEPDPYTLRASEGSVAVNNADRRAWTATQRWVETKAPGKQTVLHPVLMRSMLDNCADVKEAVALASSVNIKGAMPGADYHLFVADRSGDARIIEWIDGEMAVTAIDHATNHYVGKHDPFGDVCGRDELIKAGLIRSAKAGMSRDFLMNLLGLVMQDPENGIDYSKTQYTCVYDLMDGGLRVFSFGNLDESWKYYVE